MTSGSSSIRERGARAVLTRRRGDRARRGSRCESSATTGRHRTPSGPSRRGRCTSCSRGRSPRSVRRRAGAAPGAVAEPEPAIVTGLAAAPGLVAGRVRVLRSPSEGKLLEAGEILVAPMTNPDWVPVIRRAGALVTDSGGTTCHAAIVSRELGVPCIVGARRATELLHDGMTVTVDATHGAVYEGDRVARHVRADGDRDGPRPVTVTDAAPEPGAGGARHTRLREPRDAGPGRAGREHARRRCRAPARRVHAHRGARRRAPAEAARGRPGARAGRSDGGCPPADHTRVRAAARRLPDDRLSQQRVPRARREEPSTSRSRTTR